MSMNVVALIGRLARNPELKQTQSGVSVCNFTLAVDRDYKNGDERVTDWIDCVAWRGTADFLAKYCTKGRNIAVAGQLQSRKWQDKDGNNRTAWEVQVSNIYFADSKRDGDGGGKSTSAQTTTPDVTYEDLGSESEDLPF